MSSKDAPRAAAEWRKHWTLVLASAVGFSFFSLMLAASGLFMAPIEKEFGWTRSFYSLGPSIATFATAVLAIPIGMVIDRTGARRMVLVGTLLTMAAIAAFGAMTGATWHWLLGWAFFGLVGVTLKSTAWTAAVVGVFQQSRGLALGLTLAGTAVASMVVPPLGHALITAFGWRMAFVWLAVGWGGVTFVLAWLFFFDAHSRLRRGDEVQVDTSGLPGLTPAEALRDSALWRLGVSNFVVMVLTLGLSIHLIQILTEAGVERGHAVWLSSLTGVTGILGKLVTGALLDRFAPNWVGGLTLGAAAGGFVLLINGIASPAAIITAMLINGYAFGSKTQITGFLTASYAGMKHFGLIYGVMSALLAAASGLGPLLAGIAYDAAGHYGPFLIAGTIGCALSGLLMLTMPRYPVWERRTAETFA